MPYSGEAPDSYPITGWIDSRNLDSLKIWKGWFKAKKLAKIYIFYDMTIIWELL